MILKIVFSVLEKPCAGSGSYVPKTLLRLMVGRFWAENGNDRCGAIFIHPMIV